MPGRQSDEIETQIVNFRLLNADIRVSLIGTSENLCTPLAKIANTPEVEMILATLHVVRCFKEVLPTSMLIALVGLVTSAHAAPCGDTDNSGRIDITDAVYLVSYIFAGGPAPQDDAAGDVDCSNRTDITDAVFMINYIFASGPAPCSAPECNPNVITDQERLAALNAIDSVGNLLEAVSPDSFATALLAFLNSRDEFEAAGKQGSSVWARFDDGRMVMIPNNRFPGAGPVEPYPAGYEPVDQAVEVAARPLPPRRDELRPSEESQGSRLEPTAPFYGVPHSVQSAVFSTLGANCYTLGQPYINYLLDQGGYWRSAIQHPSPADLATVQDYGFFYIDAHGGVCISDSSTVITGIWTNTMCSEDNDSVFKPQLDADELVYMYAKGGSGALCKNQWRYAFTGKFVSSYMSFAPNSFVYIGACESDAPSLRAGFAAAGASVFAGWTMTVGDPATNKAAEFLVDRMLGVNLAVLTPKESPKQRPFDHVQLLQDMTNRGFDVDLTTGSELRITQLNPGFGMLAPSLRFAYIINFTDTLFLTGYFGEDPGNKGHVYVNGVEQTVYQWEPTFIWASIPTTGPGSAGAITVEIEPTVGPASPFGTKRKSNPINLTKWYGKFEYTVQDAGSLLGTISFWCGMRADVHSFREAPHTTPAPNPYIVFGGDLDSHAWGKAEGTFHYTVEQDPPPNDECTWTWSGQTPDIPCIPYNVGGVDNPFGTFLLQGTIYAPTKLMALMVTGSLGGQGLMAESLYCSLSGLQSESEIALSPPFFLYDITPFQISVSFNPNWDILNEVNTWSTCCSKDPENDGTINDVHHKIQWLGIPASYPPDETAAQ